MRSLRPGSSVECQMLRPDPFIPFIFTNYHVQVKIFEMAGCKYSRTRGDHLIYHYPGYIRPVVIPKYKVVPEFIIKNNMRVIGLSREEYFEILGKV